MALTLGPLGAFSVSGAAQAARSSDCNTGRLAPCRYKVSAIGPEPLVDAVVHVTGNSYRLGTLEVGASQTVSVQAHGESGVELEFTRGAGERLRLNAGGYFEASGYEGTIEIELDSGAIVRNDHRISLWPSWL